MKRSTIKLRGRAATTHYLRDREAGQAVSLCGIPFETRAVELGKSRSDCQECLKQECLKAEEREELLAWRRAGRDMIHALNYDGHNGEEVSWDEVENAADDIKALLSGYAK